MMCERCDETFTVVRARAWNTRCGYHKCGEVDTTQLLGPIDNIEARLIEEPPGVIRLMDLVDNRLVVFTLGRRPCSISLSQDTGRPAGEA
jgi:hypothetical protein